MAQDQPDGAPPSLRLLGVQRTSTDLTLPFSRPHPDQSLLNPPPLTHTQIPRRSASDCRTQWLQHDHPSLAFGKWSKPSLSRLYAIVERLGEVGQWVAISEELAREDGEKGDKRTPAECLRMWRRRLGQKKEFTKEEDEAVKQGVAMFGENWQASELLASPLKSAELTPLTALQSPSSLAANPTNATIAGTRRSSPPSSAGNGPPRRTRRSRRP